MEKEKIKKLDSWFNAICSEIEASYHIPITCRGGTVIDCGSNAGGFPVVFNARFDRYICYEADPDNHGYSKKKIKQLAFPQFNLSEICTFENKACYKNGGETVSIYRHNNEVSGDNSIYEGKDHPAENKITEVKTVSIEDIKEKYFCDKCLRPIELLKCDIEGAEYDFLLNKDLSIFKFMIVETHDRAGKEAPMHELIDFISKTHNVGVVDRVLTAWPK